MRRTADILDEPVLGRIPPMLGVIYLGAVLPHGVEIDWTGFTLTFSRRRWFEKAWHWVRKQFQEVKGWLYRWAK